MHIYNLDDPFAPSMSFQEYLNFRRLEEAVRLIGQGKMTLLEISIASGFSDQKYMTKNVPQEIWMPAKGIRIQSAAICPGAQGKISAGEHPERSRGP